MFLSLQTYGVIIIVAVVILQYVLAVFCLLKLAYFDITKREYVLWNVLILLVFFIGSAIFLIYYHKNKQIKAVKPELDEPPEEKAEEVPDEPTGESEAIDDNVEGAYDNTKE